MPPRPKKKVVRQTNRRKTSPETVRSCSTCSSISGHSGSVPSDDGGNKREPVPASYRRIKLGLRKSNPAAIVLWAFHKIPSQKGLTSRRVIQFLKNRYKVVDNPRKVGKCIGAMLRCAVEFGLLEKRGNRYFLKR